MSVVRSSFIAQILVINLNMQGSLSEKLAGALDAAPELEDVLNSADPKGLRLRSENPEAEGSSDDGAEGLDKATEMSGTKPFKFKPDTGERTPADQSDAVGPPVESRRSRSTTPARRKPEPEAKRGPRVLRQSGRRLRDSDLVRLAGEHEQQSGAYDEIDFSRNDLTSESISGIVDICKKSKHLKILKLFNNRLGDDGAEELGEIFRHCTCIEEVHLSHNDFTRKGVESLVWAADKNLPRNMTRPLWLRLEHNKVSDTERFARDLERDCPAVCGREDRHRCTPRLCAKGRRIHLPFLIEAPKGRGRGKQESLNQRSGRRDSRRRPRASPRRRARTESRDSRSRSARRRMASPVRRHRPRARSVRVARGWRGRGKRPPSGSSTYQSSRSPRPRTRRPSPQKSESVPLPPAVTKLRVKAKPRPRAQPDFGKSGRLDAHGAGRTAARAKVSHVRPPRGVRDGDAAEYSYYSEDEYEYSYA